MKAFFNNEEQKDINAIIRSLKERNAEEGDYEETGGLGVRVEQNTKEHWEFCVYRTLAFTSEKKAGK